MRRRPNRSRLLGQGRTQAFVLAGLILAGGIALAGPTGILAWSENRQLLTERRAELAKLTKQRDELRNRVDLLDPRNADPDLVGELLRRNLNVAHPDEIVVQRR
jgi:cell division protein FtsB